jgi:hypothetical protein
MPPLLPFSFLLAMSIKGLDDAGRSIIEPEIKKKMFDSLEAGRFSYTFFGLLKLPRKGLKFTGS